MNKYIKIQLFFIIFSLTGALWGNKAYAQAEVDGAGSGYFNVLDYSGLIIQHRFQFRIYGPDINLPNWSLRARVSTLFNPEGGQQNRIGTPFPPENIKIRFSGSEGGPTLGQINAPLAPIPLVAGGEAVLIASSQAPLLSAANNYREFFLYYDVIIEGGAYLDQMKNREQYQIIVYNVPIEFILYDASGAPLYVDNNHESYRIQINQHLSGSPGPVEPDFSLEILGAASDGTLDFNSLSTYLNGTSVSYSDAVKVNSKSSFELTVKSQHHQFTNPVGDVLPVEVLQVRLAPGSASPSAASYSHINLSTNPQTVMYSNNGSSQPMLMDLEYRAAGNDDRLIQANSGKYTTVLTYQLIPR